MNYYDILKIDKNASEQEIKESYKQMIKRYHPDLYPGNKAKAESITRDLNEAYETLSDPEKKAIYDLSLEEQHSKHYYATDTKISPYDYWYSTQDNNDSFDEKLRKNIYNFVDKKTTNISSTKKKNIILVIIFFAIIILFITLIDFINFKISLIEEQKKHEEMDTDSYTPTINEYFNSNYIDLYKTDETRSKLNKYDIE